MRVWFNHWFSSAVNIIDLIKRDNPDVVIIGSNERMLSPISTVCDEWYEEPYGSSCKDSSIYAENCLEFAKKHNIDVIIPRRGQSALSKWKQAFTDIGKKVMVEDNSVIELFADKGKMYDALGKEAICAIPRYRVVNTRNDFAAAYRALRKHTDVVVCKFARDEGGTSYRFIADTLPFNVLMGQNIRFVTFGEILAALPAENEMFESIILMPYLSGREVSIDCLKTTSGLIALPREKKHGRIEVVKYSQNKELIQTCDKIINRYGIQWPCNIQFRYDSQNIPYVLDINTRMSGGIQYACAISGINIPSVAYNKLIGVDKPWYQTCKEGYVSHVETPIVLDTWT